MSGALASCLLKQSLCLWIIHLGHYQWIIKGILQAYLSKNLWGCHLVVPHKWRVACAPLAPRRVNTGTRQRLNGRDGRSQLRVPSSAHWWASLHRCVCFFTRWIRRLMALRKVELAPSGSIFVLKHGVATSPHLSNSFWRDNEWRFSQTRRIKKKKKKRSMSEPGASTFL